MKKFLGMHTEEKRERLLSYLGRTGFENYQKVPKLQDSPLEDLSLLELLGKIHPSHFIEIFSKIPQENKIVYISALPPHVRKEVATSLHITDSLYEYDKKFQEVICNEIMQLLTDGKEAMLPLSYIPEDPLLFLAKSDSIELSTLCCFLGLFDLFDEIKHVINGKLLVKLEDALSDDELRLLRNIEGWRSDKISFEEIGLERWNGDTAILRSVIKERGINRLAKALMASPGDLVWFVEHLMDGQMKSEFRKYRAEMSNREIIDALVKQVVFCWDKVCTLSN